jgi:ERF superfamily
VSAPSVYTAINAITAELAKIGIAKSRINEIDDYKYRSIDDVFERLAPLLAKHRLCVLPRALERTVLERSDEQDRLLIHVALRVSFSLTSAEDGSCHAVEAYGEALDAGDKATAKAMSGAYKSAMVQTFCIPVGGAEEPDRASHRLTAKIHAAEPVQGWAQWCLDIGDIVMSCESEQAISTVQELNRSLLKALACEKPQLYSELGRAFLARRAALSFGSRRASTKTAKGRGRAKGRRPTANGSQAPELEHA